MRHVVALVLLFSAGCGSTNTRDHQLVLDDPASKRKIGSDIATVRGVCIKVDKIATSTFTNDLEFIAVWILRPEDEGGLAVFTCHPKSPNWRLMSQFAPYRRYEMRLKTGKEKPTVLSVEDLGEVVK